MTQITRRDAIKVVSETLETPVVHTSDVLVAGGGVAGCCAAIAAARLGAKVLLIERYGYLGGIATGWPVPLIYTMGRPDNPVVGGIPREIWERVDALGGWRGPGDPTVEARKCDGIADMELLKGVLLEMVLEAGVELLLHTWVVGAVTEDDCVKGLIVESKSGRQALLGKVVVDASGDGDVAAYAGAEFKYRPYDPRNPDERIHNSVMFAMVLGGEQKQKSKDETLEATGAGAQAIIKEFEEKNPERFAELKQELEAQGGSMNICFPALCLQGDPLDAWDLTRMEVAIQHKMMVSLAFLRQNIPGLESLSVKRISPQFGQREGRRPVGLYELTGEDLKESRKFDDGVCFKDTDHGKDRAHIPYRCLVPVKVDGLLFGTRALSATPAALGWIRLIGTSMGIGHAAGAAAGLCVREGVEPRELCPELLRETLKQQQALC